MMILTRTAILCGAIALSACTNPDRLGGVGATDDLANDATALDATGTGGPNDPTSPAYFSQTIGDRVFFEVDQVTLTAAGQATLSVT